MKQISSSLMLILLFNVASDSYAGDKGSGYNPNSDKKPDNTSTLFFSAAAVIGLGAIGWYFWPSESNEDYLTRHKTDLEKDSNKFMMAHECKNIFSPNNGLLGRYNGQTEDVLYKVDNFLLEHETKGSTYKKEIQVLLGKYKSSASNLKNRSSNITDKDLYQEYEYLKDQYGDFIGTLQEIDLFLSEHEEFFKINSLHQSIYKNFGDMLSVSSNEKSILQESTVFSSTPYPHIDCVTMLDKTIRELSIKESKVAKLYPKQNDESHRLSGKLEHIRKVIKSSPVYQEEVARKEDNDHKNKMLKLEEQKLIEQRAAQRRAEEECKRQNRKAEDQIDQKLALQRQELEVKKQANQLKKEELSQKELPSCQPINLYVNFEQTEGQNQQSDLYVDQYGNAYQRHYYDEYGNVWVLYQMLNGMLYYMNSVNGYEYYRDVMGNDIQRPY